MLGTEDKKINNIVSFLKELTATGQCGVGGGVGNKYDRNSGTGNGAFRETCCHRNTELRLWDHSGVRRSFFGSDT